jgi:uncharacterized membrane protein
MASTRIALWTNIAVAILGLAVGTSKIVQGFGEESKTRSFAIGIACCVLALIWLIRTIAIARSGRM